MGRRVAREGGYAKAERLPLLPPPLLLLPLLLLLLLLLMPLLPLAPLLLPPLPPLPGCAVVGGSACLFERASGDLEAEHLGASADHRDRDLAPHLAAQELGDLVRRQIADVLPPDADDLVALAEARLRRRHSRRSVVHDDAAGGPFLPEHGADRADRRRACRERDEGDERDSR